MMSIKLGKENDNDSIEFFDNKSDLSSEEGFDPLMVADEKCSISSLTTRKQNT
jgi:hypothetical protein